MIDFLVQNKEIVNTLIVTGGGIVIGWLGKIGKDKYQSGQNDERRVARQDTLKEFKGRISNNEREISAIKQRAIDCRASRDDFSKGFRDFMCLKMTEMERRIMAQLTLNRDQAKREKASEMAGLKIFMVERIEEYLKEKGVKDGD